MAGFHCLLQSLMMKTISYNSPLISVIVPFYNPKVEYLKEAVESILAQSYENWEAIFINDGSGRNISKKIEQYLSEVNDKRISLTNVSCNMGVSYAKNTGIKLSKGQIITFLDSDDIYLPWCLEEIQINISENTDCHLFVADSIYIKHLIVNVKKLYSSKLLFELAGNKTTVNDLLKLFSKKVQPTVPRFFFKRHILNEVLFDSELNFDEDLDLCLQIAEINNFIVSVIKKPVYIYRNYASGRRLSRKKVNIVNSLNKIITKYENSTNKNIQEFIENKIKSNILREVPKTEKFRDILGGLKLLLFTDSKEKYNNTIIRDYMDYNESKELNNTTSYSKKLFRSLTDGLYC